MRDPDGRLAVFGTRTRPPQPSLADAAVGGLPGQLEHVVVASARFPAMLRFYTETLGFMLSDTVHQDAPAAHEGEMNVCFLRADEMHHCFAVFRAPQSRADHHAYETTGWNDLKLWADHFASLEVPIWWGPGRHGAGNNLFFMIKDPDGNNIEISAELETMKKGQPGRKWMGAGARDQPLGRALDQGHLGDVVANAQLVRPRSRNSGLNGLPPKAAAHPGVRPEISLLLGNETNEQAEFGLSVRLFCG